LSGRDAAPRFCNCLNLVMNLAEIVSGALRVREQLRFLAWSPLF